MSIKKTVLIARSENFKLQDCRFIELPQISDLSDFEIHEWLIHIFNDIDSDIEQLIVEIGDEPLLSLKIGYHIRLSLESLREKTLLPILFISVRPLETLLAETGIYSHILNTKGVYFTTLDDIERLNAEIVTMTGLSSDEYLSGFLEIICIKPDEVLDKLSLTDVWGAFAMARAVNIRTFTGHKLMKRLYFKYLSAFGNLAQLQPATADQTESLPNTRTTDKIIVSNKKILFINLSSIKWMDVLLQVIVTPHHNDYTIINRQTKKVRVFAELVKQLVNYSQFDLYLVNSNFVGADQNGNYSLGDLYTIKILQKIKQMNVGNQVMVLTATNSAFDLKPLLDAGADGIYVKESPEYRLSQEQSLQNYLHFKNSVIQCFKRSHLKNICTHLKTIHYRLYHLPDDSFKQELTKQFDLFWSLVSKAQTRVDFAYSYITLYLVIEIINRRYHSEIMDEYFKNRLDGDESFEQLGEWSKIAVLYIGRWKQEDVRFLRHLNFLMQNRNNFIHNNHAYLDKRDAYGRYINHYIYNAGGSIKLLSAIEHIIELMANYEE